MRRSRCSSRSLWPGAPMRARGVGDGSLPLAGSKDGATAIDVLETLVDVTMSQGTPAPWNQGRAPVLVVSVGALVAPWRRGWRRPTTTIHAACQITAGAGFAAACLPSARPGAACSKVVTNINGPSSISGDRRRGSGADPGVRCDGDDARLSPRSRAFRGSVLSRAVGVIRPQRYGLGVAGRPITVPTAGSGGRRLCDDARPTPIVGRLFVCRRARMSSARPPRHSRAVYDLGADDPRARVLPVALVAQDGLDDPCHALGRTGGAVYWRIDNMETRAGGAHARRVCEGARPLGSYGARQFPAVAPPLCRTDWLQ